MVELVVDADADADADAPLLADAVGSFSIIWKKCGTSNEIKPHSNCLEVQNSTNRYPLKHRRHHHHLHLRQQHQMTQHHLLLWNNQHHHLDDTEHYDHIQSEIKENG